MPHHSHEHPSSSPGRMPLLHLKSPGAVAWDSVVVGGVVVGDSSLCLGSEARLKVPRSLCTQSRFVLPRSDMHHERRRYLIPGAAPDRQQSASEQVTSHQVGARVSQSRESRLAKETSPTRVGWAGLNLALRELASPAPAVEPRPLSPGCRAGRPHQQETAVRQCVPFLNGILLATEENHTATVLVPWLCSHSPLLPAALSPSP